MRDWESSVRRWVGRLWAAALVVLLSVPLGLAVRADETCGMVCCRRSGVCCCKKRAAGGDGWWAKGCGAGCLVKALPGRGVAGEAAGEAGVGVAPAERGAGRAGELRVWAGTGLGWAELQRPPPVV